MTYALLEDGCNHPTCCSFKDYLFSAESEDPWEGRVPPLKLFHSYLHCSLLAVHGKHVYLILVSWHRCLTSRVENSHLPMRALYNSLQSRYLMHLLLGNSVQWPQPPGLCSSTSRLFCVLLQAEGLLWRNLSLVNFCFLPSSSSGVFIVKQNQGVTEQTWETDRKDSTIIQRNLIFGRMLNANLLSCFKKEYLILASYDLGNDYMLFS